MLTSIIRTLVPLLVGVLGPLATNRLGWTDATLTGVLTAVVAGVYYLAVRGLEQVRPGIGVLLGVPSQPSYARDGEHELGRAEDTGRTRLFVLLVVGFLAVATLLAVPASARAPRRPVATHVQVNGVCTSGGVLDVASSLEDLIGREWTFRQDDGAVTVQLRTISGRNGPTGQAWVPVASTSGGEGHRRVNRNQLFYDLVRVEWRGIVSSGRPVGGPCS